jgi:hypothetical protein
MGNIHVDHSNPGQRCFEFGGTEEVFAGCTRGIADQLSYVEEEASVL